jgi:cell division protein FtsB
VTFPPARIVALTGALALAAFAVYAGEYSTFDWLKLRSQLAAERDSTGVVESQLDSLARVAVDLENNPATQERVAREQFGMIRNGEILYRLFPKTP